MREGSLDRVERRRSERERDERERENGGQTKATKGEIDREWKGGREEEVQ